MTRLLAFLLPLLASASQLPFMVGCSIQKANTCFLLNVTASGEQQVYLANQRNLFRRRESIDRTQVEFWNYAYGDIYSVNDTLPPCHPSTKMETIEWDAPVRDDGVSVFNNPPTLRVQKVGWMVNTTDPRSYNLVTLWSQEMVDTFNALNDIGLCNYAQPWEIGVTQSVRGAGVNCPVSLDCTMHDLAVRTKGGLGRFTAGDISPPCDASLRATKIAEWYVEFVLNPLDCLA